MGIKARCEFFEPGMNAAELYQLISRFSKISSSDRKSASMLNSSHDGNVNNCNECFMITSFPVKITHILDPRDASSLKFM